MSVPKFTKAELAEDRQRRDLHDECARAYLQSVIDLRDWHNPEIIAYADKLGREMHWIIESSRFEKLAQLVAFMDGFEAAYEVAFEAGYQDGTGDAKMRARHAER